MFGTLFCGLGRRPKKREREELLGMTNGQREEMSHGSRRQRTVKCPEKKGRKREKTVSNKAADFTKRWRKCGDGDGYGHGDEDGVVACVSYWRQSDHCSWHHRCG